MSLSSSASSFLAMRENHQPMSIDFIQLSQENKSFIFNMIRRLALDTDELDIDSQLKQLEKNEVNKKSALDKLICLESSLQIAKSYVLLEDTNKKCLSYRRKARKRYSKIIENAGQMLESDEFIKYHDILHLLIGYSFHEKALTYAWEFEDEKKINYQPAIVHLEEIDTQGWPTECLFYHFSVYREISKLYESIPDYRKAEFFLLKIPRNLLTDADKDNLASILCMHAEDSYACDKWEEAINFLGRSIKERARINPQFVKKDFYKENTVYLYYTFREVVSHPPNQSLLSEKVLEIRADLKNILQAAVDFFKRESAHNNSQESNELNDDLQKVLHLVNLDIKKQQSNDSNMVVDLRADIKNSDEQDSKSSLDFTLISGQSDVPQEQKNDCRHKSASFFCTPLVSPPGGPSIWHEDHLSSVQSENAAINNLADSFDKSFSLRSKP